MFIESSDRVKLYLEERGNGQTCMFLHGGPGAWCESFKETVGGKLEKIFSMIYFDQRGCGRSEGNRNTDYSIVRMVRDIEEIREKLGIQKLTLLAHSFGGIIAVNYAFKFKENLERLILLSTTLDIIDSLKSQLEYGRVLLNETKSYESDDLIDEWNKVITKIINKDEFYKFHYDKKESSKVVDIIDSKIENRHMAEQAFSNKDYAKDYTNLTRKIHIPTLVITGQNDYAIGLNHYQKFKFPNCHIVKIEGKHGIYVEKSDEIISIIRDFILKK